MESSHSERRFGDTLVYLDLLRKALNRTLSMVGGLVIPYTPMQSLVILGRMQVLFKHVILLMGLVVFWGGGGLEAKCLSKRSKILSI